MIDTALRKLKEAKTILWFISLFDISEYVRSQDIAGNMLCTISTSKTGI